MRKTPVHVHTWSEWLELPHSRPHVSIINVARSSAWTPPWHDQDFEAFLRRLPHRESTCLDCDCDTPGGHDACTPREWQAPQEDPFLQLAKAAR